MDVEFREKTTAERLREHWRRVMRAVPLLGLGAHLGHREERLEQEREQDALYRKVMASMGAVPKHPHLSEERARAVMAGELAGHAVALAVGLGLYLWTGQALRCWLSTWVLGILADSAGGGVAGWLVDRRADALADEDP